MEGSLWRRSGCRQYLRVQVTRPQPPYAAMRPQSQAPEPRLEARSSFKSASNSDVPSCHSLLMQIVLGLDQGGCACGRSCVA